MADQPSTEKLVQLALSQGYSLKYIEQVKDRLWLVDGKLRLQPRLGPMELCGGPESLYDPYRTR